MYVSDRSAANETEPRSFQATRGDNALQRFPVWIRPLTNGLMLAVEGRDKVDWLLKRLSQSFVFKTSEPVIQEEHSDRSMFRLAYSSRMPRQKLEQLLATMPEILVTLDTI